jgi:hypothetical protein
MVFFLANRSQEQVTDEYQAHARAIEAIVPQIAVESERLAPQAQLQFTRKSE